MSSEMVDQIAKAVLYEGYLLYPYRKSALKNQQRWNFGVLYPPSWAASQTGSERSYFQLECLTRCDGETRIEISLRFLRLEARENGEGAWQEAFEQRVNLPPLSIAELIASHREQFLLGESGDAGEVKVSAAPVSAGTNRVTVRVSNLCDFAGVSRNDALLHSLASSHAVLEIRQGEFVSQIDPPEQLREAAAACQNVGVWPVLVGESDTRRTMLGSPIILYDYPQVAAESKGDLFDSTEIDEILILRILTLTDAEKEEVRRTDERARRILERLETSPPEHLLNLHGAIRGMRQPRGDAWSSWDTLDGAPVASAEIRGVAVRKGDRVRLHPQKRADIIDTLLEDKIAIIEAVEEDFERNVHLAVVLEDDPGRDLGEMRQAGHRFFFSIDEIEPIDTEKVIR